MQWREGKLGNLRKFGRDSDSAFGDAKARDGPNRPARSNSLSTREALFKVSFQARKLSLSVRRLERGLERDEDGTHVSPKVRLFEQLVRVYLAL